MTNTHAVTETHESDSSDGVFDEKFKPLTAEEARQWRQSNPVVSPWWVIRTQILVTCVFAVAVWWGFGRVVAVSAIYGAVAVIFPAMVLARGLRRQPALKITDCP